MFISFNTFIAINENSKDLDLAIHKIAKNIINLIKNIKVSKQNSFKKLKKIHFSYPYEFDLVIYINKQSSPDFKKNIHFKKLPWEEINFKNKGFSIDANVIILPNKKEEIRLFLLIDPNKEPNCYKKLYFKLNEIFYHEFHHLTQVGRNRHPFRSLPVPSKVRSSVKNSYKYFLLKDEIEALVKGMKKRSDLQKIPLDKVFNEYLLPFLKYGFINKNQYNKIMKAWIKHSFEKYPDAIFSKNVKNFYF